MKLHSDDITRHHLQDARDYASRVAGKGEVHTETASLRGSRSRHHAWEVRLQGDGSVSRRRVNPGHSGGDRSGFAATYDQWGHFLAYLYRIDPRMIATGAYTDRDDFETRTHREFVAPQDA